MRYYPIYLDLRNRDVLIVGGGAIAEAKAQQLVEAGARVHLVSPTLTPRLTELVEQSAIKHRASDFAPLDLMGMSLVISATDDQRVNEEVARLAVSRGLLCNVVDQPALCNFITPALVTRGDLQISVSSGGGSPTLTQRVKREIAELIGNEYGELLDLAAEMRAEAKWRISDFERRRDVLRAFVESEAIDLLRAGKRDGAWRIAQAFLDEAAGEGGQNEHAANNVVGV